MSWRWAIRWALRVPSPRRLTHRALSGCLKDRAAYVGRRPLDDRVRELGLPTLVTDLLQCRPGPAESRAGRPEVSVKDDPDLDQRRRPAGAVKRGP